MDEYDDADEEGGDHDTSAVSTAQSSLSAGSKRRLSIGDEDGSVGDEVRKEKRAKVEEAPKAVVVASGPAPKLTSSSKEPELQCINCDKTFFASRGPEACFYHTGKVANLAAHPICSRLLLTPLRRGPREGR